MTRAAASLLLVGCAAVPPVDAPVDAPRPVASPRQPVTTNQARPGAPEEKLEGWMLVFEDAAFYTASDLKTVRYAGDPFDRTALPHDVLAVRALARRGDFYEVLLTEAPENVCVGSSSPIRGIALQLLVHRRDVATVVTAPFTRTYDDGTRVDVAPGALATRIDDASITLVTGDLTTTIRGARPQVGVVFTPAAVEPAERGKMWLDAKQKDEIRFGSDTDGGTAYATARSNRGGHDLEVARVNERVGTSTRIRVEGRCASIEGSVLTSALKKNGAGWGMGVGCGRVRNPDVVPVDTELYFPDGQRAGKTIRAIDVAVRNADWGANACFFVGTDPLCPGSAEGAIELCVVRGSLVAAPRD